MTIRLSIRSLAGTERTLVAVGTARLAVMLVTVRAAAPRSLLTSAPAGAGAGGVCAAGAPGAAAGEDGCEGACGGAARRADGGGAAACGAGAAGGGSGAASGAGLVAAMTGWGPVPLPLFS